MEAGSQHGQVREYLEMSTDNAHDKVNKTMLSQEKIDSRIFYRSMKKLTDRVLSALALILLSPLFLVISILIKREDRGPVFYTQRRIGRNGKIFSMYKFRSMVVHADQKLEKLADQNEVEGAMFKMKNDPRVTKIGRIIRKYSLDELPQLLNVVQGDMSLVGPRPPLEKEIQQYTNYDMQRLMVTPGCTGLWQVTKRNSVGFHEMVELDIEYINKSNYFYDISILFKTIQVMVRPNEAY